MNNLLLISSIVAMRILMIKFKIGFIKDSGVILKSHPNEKELLV